MRLCSRHVSPPRRWSATRRSAHAASGSRRRGRCRRRAVAAAVLRASSAAARCGASAVAAVASSPSPLGCPLPVPWLGSRCGSHVPGRLSSAGQRRRGEARVERAAQRVEVQRARRTRAPCPWRAPAVRCVRPRRGRVFDRQRRVFSLQQRRVLDRAADAHAQLDHPQLHRDDPDQRERDHGDPRTPADQPVEQAVGQALHPCAPLGEQSGPARRAGRSAGGT